jgi:hypothetical protein
LDLMSVDSSGISLIGGTGRIMDSRSRGMGTEWKEAWSRRDKARLQKLSCCAAGVDGRERG